MHRAASRVRRQSSARIGKALGFQSNKLHVLAALTFFAAASLLTEAPVAASVTLPLEPMNARQLEAVDRARSLVEAMPRGVTRHQAAAYIAYRLMMRGDCPRALPVMNRELLDIADPMALNGLITGAVAGRDPRCMAWVAARTDAVLDGGSLPEAQRPELRVRGQTLFELVGQMTRASEMPPADEDLLEIVPESERQRTIPLGDTVLHIGFANPPTRRETLLIERLSDYRGTPLQLRLARAFAQRARTEPRFLSFSGWTEVALALLAGGDPAAAEQVLVDGGFRSLSLAGLQAEAAFREHDYARAAPIFAANQWGVKQKSIYRIFQRRPELFIPYIEGDQVFGADNDTGLHLVSYSEALDRSGHKDAAERAARAALTRLGVHRNGVNRMAYALARIGRVEAARALLGEPADDPNRAHPNLIWEAIVEGATRAGNLVEVERALEDAPANIRNLLLIKAMAAAGPTRSPMHDALEARLAARIAETPTFGVSTDAMVAFVVSRVRPDLIVTLARRLPRRRESAQAAIRVARAARQEGNRALAIAVAEVAGALLPAGPQGDAELVELADVYWRLEMRDLAMALAMRVSHPVGQVDAVSRAFHPTRGDVRTKLSFQTF